MRLILSQCLANLSVRFLMNRNSYNKIAHLWNVARNGFFGREREYLDAILSVAPIGSTILDLGCGTGRPMAEYIVSRGRCVLGVDQSEEMLRLARQKLPHEQWVLSSIESYEPVEGITALCSGIRFSIFGVQNMNSS